MFKRYLFERVRGKTKYQRFFQRLHSASLEGLNIGWGGCYKESGELAVVELLSSRASGPLTVFDVGANAGDYAGALLGMLQSKILLYCFEPSKIAYESLQKRHGGNENFRAYNFGLGASDTTTRLFADQQGSELASVFNRRLDHFGLEFRDCENVELKRLDGFCAEAGISRINLLKLDVEGNELNVLIGATGMIENDSIDFIQFEFGGCNIDSRTFFQDFYYLLTPRYKLYRIAKNGLVPITRYDERLEVFLTTNYLAERHQTH